MSEPPSAHEAPTANEVPPSGPPKRSLTARALQGSAWTFIGFGMAQFVRLAGNIIVARLLAPEMFGIMTIVTVVMFTVNMMSDVGLGQLVIRHERGDEKDFLNTAWTLQVIRGVLLFLATCLCAWPVATLFGEPIMLYAIPAIGFTAVIDGLVTMKSFTTTRHLALGRQSMVELLSQIIGVVGMVWLAFLYPSIWSLVAGWVLARVAFLILAQFILPGMTNWFRLEREAVRDLLNFGKWIVSSSVLMLIGKQLDKPALGLLDSMAVLGVYDRAGRLSEPFPALSGRLARRVVFPAMSSVHRERPKQMQSAFYRARLALDMAFLPLMGLLIVCAPIAVEILYDDRYQAAGWILQIFMLRVAMRCVLEPNRECLIAAGLPQYLFWLTLGRTIWVVAGIPVGWYFWGLPGLVWAMGLSEIFPLLIVWYGMKRQRILNVRREAFSAVLVGLGALVGLGLAALWSAMLAEHWALVEAWIQARLGVTPE